MTRLWVSPANNKFAINDPYPYGVPFARTDASLPSVVFNHYSCPRWNHNPDKKGFPVTLRFPPNFPPNYTSKECADGTGVVYDSVLDKVFELYEIRPDQHTASIVRTWDIRGPGHASTLGNRTGTSASGIATVVGAVRAFELESSGMPIRHAFHIAVPRKKENYMELLGRGVQWPAVSGDGGAKDAENNNGPIPYGALLAIPPVEKGGPDLTKLGLSEAGLRFAEALRDYGTYVVDGAGVVAFRADAPLGPNGKQVRGDLKKIMPLLRMVTNSVEGANAHIPVGSATVGEVGTPTWPAGGGTPLAPNCAFDAP